MEPMETTQPLRVPRTCNQENMALWVRALLSGEYDQCTGALRRNYVLMGPRFCCLGVACEVAIEAGVEVEAEHRESGVSFYGGNDTILPPAVVHWLGLVPIEVDPIVEIGPQGVGIVASAANDSRGWAFKRIAQGIIETYGLQDLMPQ